MKVFRLWVIVHVWPAPDSEATVMPTSYVTLEDAERAVAWFRNNRPSHKYFVDCTNVVLPGEVMPEGVTEVACDHAFT